MRLLTLEETLLVAGGTVCDTKGGKGKGGSGKGSKGKKGKGGK